MSWMVDNASFSPCSVVEFLMPPNHSSVTRKFSNAKPIHNLSKNWPSKERLFRRRTQYQNRPIRTSRHFKNEHETRQQSIVHPDRDVGTAGQLYPSVQTEIRRACSTTASFLQSVLVKQRYPIVSIEPSGLSCWQVLLPLPWLPI